MCSKTFLRNCSIIMWDGALAQEIGMAKVAIDKRQRLSRGLRTRILA